MRRRKVVKITLIVLASLLVLAIIAITIAARILVTPERLTPIVNKQAARFISCEYHFGKVELTVFKTFPDVGVKINDVILVNPTKGAPSDTLAKIKECVVSLNIRELLKSNNYIINKFFLEDAFTNLFVDSKGNTNFDVFIIPESEDDSQFTIGGVDIQKVDVKKLNVSYRDRSNDISTKINNINTTIQGNMKDDVINAKAKLNTGSISFALSDSNNVVAKSNNLALDFNGKLVNFDEIEGDLALDLSKLFLSLKDSVYVDKWDASLDAPLYASINKQAFSTNLAIVKVKEHLLKIKGSAAYKKTGDVEMDLQIESETWDIGQLLTLVPSEFNYLLENIDMSGDFAFTGALRGTYNDTLIPSISVGVKLYDAAFSHTTIPYHFQNINTHVHLDLTDDGNTSLTIENFEAKTGESDLSLSGTVKDLMTDGVCDLQVAGNVNLPELAPLLPKDITAIGNVDLTATGSFTIGQLTNLELEKIKASGSIKAKGLDVSYGDSMLIKSDVAVVDFSMPPKEITRANRLLSAEIDAGALTVSMTDLLDANLKNASLEMTISNFMDTTRLPFIDCAFSFGNISMEMDTLFVKSTQPSGIINLKPATRNPQNPDIHFSFNNSSLQLRNGKNIYAGTEKLALEGHAVYDDKKEEFLLQWNPNLKVDLQNATVNMAEIPYPIEIPSINFDFTPGKFDIQKSRIIFGNSIFNLSGLVTDIDKYLDKTGLLKGDLEFVSDFVDVNQIMDVFNGLNADSTEIEEKENATDNPFMVPHGIDITLVTTAKNALFGNTALMDLGGKLVVKDGVLVLEQMGFTSEAAEMQLTAIYRSSRMNHLFAGVDFHLLDVNIAKLIEMLPFLEGMLPMLGSFEGDAEFHFAVETYLKSNYDIKFSTLRGAMAISGDSLVVLDGETFSEISNMLNFKKKTKNLIDSLSVEMTLFRNEVDVYPFVISIDRWQAVIDGKHNFSFYDHAKSAENRKMTGNYHISVTDTPLPIRLGLDVRAVDGDYKFKLVPCKYAHLYNPKKQRVVDQEIMRLKKLISDSLKANVKPGD
ncbi:hypothetical protein LJC68_00410 [Bacteroidales bacterium OttesenSCG-928-B11]|nr:hypothetical protein [Bacteroidales bacterium OttesenSCG-928-B11]MDL2326053.1 hypothetical protein [Bacteroidales bacterium OttesenSCG-928-A14]